MRWDGGDDVHILAPNAVSRPEAERLKSVQCVSSLACLVTAGEEAVGVKSPGFLPVCRAMVQDHCWTSTKVCYGTC